MEIKGRTLTEEERENCEDGTLSEEEIEAVRKICDHYNREFKNNSFPQNLINLFKKWNG